MPGLEFRDVRKSFGAVRALTGVTFAVRAGEAHALVGENGAGKSTLLKILAGIVRPDGGELRWQDETLSLGSPREGLERGIGMVYQEMLSFPNLSVAGNIFAGRELTSAGGVLRESEMEARTVAILDELRLKIPPRAIAESLSAAHRQLLQVARALAFDCQILVLDEPTTALTDAEADHLFVVLEKLKARGVTLLYVSHRLPEVFRLCDRITVLRDGAYAGTFARSDVAQHDIVRAMVGRDLPPRAEHQRAAQPSPALAVRNLTKRPCFEDVSLSVGAGEIVGLFGLVGSGRSELLETIFGLRTPDGGSIEIGGAPAQIRSARQAARAGIALVPEERHRQGLFFNLNLRHNLMMAARTVAGDVLIRNGREQQDAQALLTEWRVKSAGATAMPDSLSGGNQQKVVLAKWLATKPRVLMLDEPTKGVDVGAKFEIHEIVRRQAAHGLGCLVVSSDLPEILALCHRIIVMREGRMQGELAGDAATEESVMHLATSEAA
ncbi:MAG TPA: sugar ABC transporter ATP-binding protein [Vicinamibacterales bacterium]